jgi:hypothetical protein
MPTYRHFAKRAAHYRDLGLTTSNARLAESLLSLSNLFLQMSQDLRAREEATFSLEKSQYRPQATSKNPLRRILRCF